MSYDLEDHLYDSPLPTDITHRVPVYRRKGIVASLVAAVVTLGANRRLSRASRRYRSGNSPPVPDYLRQDIGLSPLPPKLPDWWEKKW
jgi:hypothetical protein